MDAHRGVHQLGRARARKDPLRGRENCWRVVQLPGPARSRQRVVGGAEGLLGIVAEGRRTTTRLLDAEFPKFRQLLPNEHTAMATVEIAPLVDAIKRVALVAERGAQVRLEFTEGSVMLSAGGDDAGRAEESHPAEFFGEPLIIAFNPGYLLDGLTSLHTDKVSFGFTTSSRPAVLRPALDEEPVPDSSGTFAAPDSDYTYLLMPVRLPG